MKLPVIIFILKYFSHKCKNEYKFYYFNFLLDFSYALNDLCLLEFTPPKWVRRWEKTL